MKTKPFVEGQLVSLARWDATVPPSSYQRLGVCKVVAIRKSRSESGWMVTILADSEHGHYRHELDSNWLQPIEEPSSTHE